MQDMIGMAFAFGVGLFLALALVGGGLFAIIYVSTLTVDFLRARALDRMIARKTSGFKQEFGPLPAKPFQPSGHTGRGGLHRG